MLLSKLFIVPFLAAVVPCLLLPKRVHDLGMENLDGDWRIVSLQARGNQTDPNAMAHVVYRIKGNKCLYMSGGAVLNEFKWTRDETLRPFTLDIEYTGDNPNSKQQYAGGVKAVYRMVDGKLERNYAEPGKPRPTDFRSTLENGHTLIMLERVK
ncbi:MAG: TIGR03067 domain-containing protein [Planctomycetia bacterium]|nr:TIGR03067 domain-containing protein [Planctomycetia bacterium]